MNPTKIIFKHEAYLLLEWINTLDADNPIGYKDYSHEASDIGRICATFNPREDRIFLTVVEGGATILDGYILDRKNVKTVDDIMYAFKDGLDDFVTHYSKLLDEIE